MFDKHRLKLSGASMMLRSLYKISKLQGICTNLPTKRKRLNMKDSSNPPPLAVEYFLHHVQ